MANIEKEIEKYSNFIHYRLRPDLQSVSDQYEKIAARLAEYNTILSTIKPLVDGKTESFKAMTDLGNNCYVKCVVPDASKIYLNIGVDCFVEFSLEEAVRYLEHLIDINRPQTDVLLEKAAEIKANIKLVMNQIDQLRVAPV